MPDLFISYARGDGAFVDALIKGLHQRDLEVWIDRSDIPPTAEWMEEIIAAIEDANAVLVMLSEPWLSSEICAIELNHAVKLGKRIIPVALADIPPRSAPDALRRLQWVRVAPDRPAEEIVEPVVQAIATDPDHLRTHTRLMRRALDWQRNGEDPNRLLRGSDLADAETWCRTTTAEPPPTDLHRAYVATSQSRARRRRRVAMIAGGLACVGATAGGVVYLAERSRSLERERIAASREVASQALAALPGSHDLPLLLALEAHRIHPTLESIDAMHRALMARPSLARMFPVPGGRGTGLRFSADGGRLAVGLRDGRVTFWDLASGTGTVAGEPAVAHVDTMTFSQDLNWAAASGSGALTVHGLGSEEPVRTPDGARFANVLGIAHAPDAPVYATANGLRGSGASLWDAITHTEIRRLATPDGFGADSVAFSPDGSRLAAAGWDRRIAIFDTGTGAIQRVLDTGADILIDALAFSPDGRSLAYPAGDEVRLVDLTATDDHTVDLRIDGEVRALAFSPDGRWLAAGLSEGRVTLFDHRARWRSRVFQDLAGYTESVAFSPDGRWLAAAGYSDNAALYDLARIGQVGSERLRHADTVTALAIAPDGSVGASGGWDRIVRLWFAADPGKPAASLEGHSTAIFGLAFDADAGRLASMGSFAGPLALRPPEWLLWDLDVSPPALLVTPPVPPRAGLLGSLMEQIAIAQGQPLGEAPTFGAMRDVLPGAVAPGVLAYVRRAPFGTTEQFEIVVDMTEGQGPRRLAGTVPGEVSGLALSANGAYLARADQDGDVEIWALENTERVAAFRSDHECRAASFSRDGLHLAVACEAEFLVISAPYEDAEPIRLTDVDGSVVLAAVAPGGALSVTIRETGDMRLWDMAARRPFGAPFGTGMPVTAAAFGHDGAALHTGHLDGSVVTWRLDLPFWEERICAIAGRDPTVEEWTRHLGGRPHRTVCEERRLLTGD